MTTHRLPVHLFDALAAGGGGLAAIGVLRAGRYSKHLFLLRAITQAVPERIDQLSADRFARDFALLARIERADPAAVEAVLSRPYTGAWLSCCLRRLRAAQLDEAALRFDLGHLGGVALAAAIRAGVFAEAELPVRAGVAVVPGVGRLAHSSDPHWVMLSTADAPSWEPLRTLSLEHDGLLLRLEIDDLDPYRDVGGLGATGRLTVLELRQWASRFTWAWQILVQRHRSVAEAMTVGLTTLVPLNPLEGSETRSATPTAAAGAITLSLPADPRNLAATLVHEFNHTKLNMLLDQVVLLRPGDERCYSPWRDDPRPLWGILHGLYAFLGVAVYWQREQAGAGERLAEFELCRGILALRAAHRTLTGSDRLTPDGLRFVEISGTVVNRLTAAVGSADPQVRRVATDLAADHRAMWRLTSGTATLPNEATSAPRVSVGGKPGSSPGRRVRLARATFEGDQRPAASAGDQHLIAGDYGFAVSAYLAELQVAPENAGAWAGLAVACGRLDRDEADRVIATQPEKVRAARPNGDDVRNVAWHLA